MHQVLDNEAEPGLQHDWNEYEAVICTVKVRNRESFLHINRFVKHIVDTFSHEVRLLVADTSLSTIEDVKQIKSWCCDNGFEFVALDCTEHISSDDTSNDEKVGIDRVLEALHCNMWKSMELHSFQLETAAPLKAATEKVSNKIDKRHHQAGNEEGKNTKAEDQTMSLSDERIEALLQALKIAEDPRVSTKDAKKSDDKDDDIDMAQFSALISEVRDVREQGKLLTNEQRRDRAAEVAMKLWHMLGEDNGSDASGSE
ncbi:unnamed protein product [Peronospora belbahrii]|nr:unnamed protein product [Peronospora belbahrii]